MKNKILVSFVFVSTLIVVGLIALDFKAKVSEASAPTGLQASTITTLNKTVGMDYPTQLAATSTCAAHIITTVAQPIMVTFDDRYTPTGTLGHYQAASTTVVYDGGMYGCGKMKAYGFNASTTITVTETR